MDYCELWKHISNYDGYYEISNFGRVRSCDRYIQNNRGSFSYLLGKIMPLSTDKYGYKVITLHKKGNRKQYKIHRLVMNAFTGANNSLQINHKDGNKENNNITNLEYCTASENMHHARFQLNKCRDKRVYQLDMNETIINIYKSTREAHRFGYDSGNISKCCNGYKKSYKGFLWRYR